MQVTRAAGERYHCMEGAGCVMAFGDHWVGIVEEGYQIYCNCTSTKWLVA